MAAQLRAGRVSGATIANAQRNSSGDPGRTCLETTEAPGNPKLVIERWIQGRLMQTTRRKRGLMPFRINHIHIKALDPRKAADWWVRAFAFKIVSDETRVFGD